MLKHVQAASLVLLLVAGPATAATITTDAFVAVAAPTLDLLDGADALAIATSDRAPVRAFAQRSRDRIAPAIRDLATWRQAEANEVARGKAGSTLDGLGPVAGLLSVPYDAVANASNSIGPPATVLPAADVIRAQDDQNLAHLQMLRGAAFDADYVALEINALARLETLYKSFTLNGDDPILRRLAVHNLPAVESQLARLRRLGV